ncbi:MAG: DUF1549 domain-containing protein [Planctomycetia bacterium]|nr:DUF1549 domain-containing protein [Planctomycetia bacterium]
MSSQPIFFTCRVNRQGSLLDFTWLRLCALLSAIIAATFALADDPPRPADPVEPSISAVDREHWSFRPLVRSEVPAVRDVAWCRTPIDQFILARLEAEGLTPLPQASRSLLIRRLSFDLTGLPPAPEDIVAFVADKGEDAYDKVVDRLLGSTAYGERWAQHWLDLVRFAETDGFEHDLERPNAWRYRDWVIDALNADLPYDEFVREQLAGDELRPDDASAVIATGFLLCGPDMPDINLQEERRHNFLNDMTGTVGSVLLGLHIGCAQCHDHKFDPVSQYDFYRLRAFFDPVAIFKDHPLPRPQGSPAPPETPTQARIRELAAEVLGMEETARKKLKLENPDLQPTKDDLMKALSDDDRPRYEKVSAELGELKKTYKAPEIPHGRTVQERASDIKPSRLIIRGDFRREGPEVSPAYLRIANRDGAAVAAPPADSATSHRRLQLANWITRPDNPLALRVIVNRIWQHHFGRGLVESSSDFGKMGAEPSHPQLLDWLATELPRRGWSLKQLHRMIVRSSVYRQVSFPSGAEGPGSGSAAAAASWAKSRQADPDNRWLARMNRQRLEGESIRDTMLAAAGRLSPRRGGPGVRPPLPPEVTATLLANQWKVSPDAEDHRRRSIYLFVRRNVRYPLFEAFDRPDTNASCPRRNRSTIAPQALILLNSEFSLIAARDLAGFVLAGAGDCRPCVGGELVGQAVPDAIGSRQNKAGSRPTIWTCY